MRDKPARRSIGNVGPFVDSPQAIAVLAALIAVFAALSALLLRRRDVA